MIKPNRIKFHVSKKREIEELIWTFANLALLKKSSSRMILPDFSEALVIKLKKIKTADFSKMNNKIQAMLLSEFNKIYDLAKYKKITGIVESNWQTIENSFFDKILELRDKRLFLRKNYICFITFYGGGGSFGRGREIYIRTNPGLPNDVKDANYTIMHELIHLMLRKHAIEKHLSHKKTEELVESLINKPQISALLSGK